MRRCPNLYNPQYRVPSSLREVTQAEIEDKRLHPENWYGMADVLAYMRFREANPKLTTDQIWDLVEQYRKHRRSLASASQGAKP
jgi:hypothetical protein